MLRFLDYFGTEPDASAKRQNNYTKCNTRKDPETRPFS